jgi:hypothetical protein
MSTIALLRLFLNQNKVEKEKQEKASPQVEIEVKKENQEKASPQVEMASPQVEMGSPQVEMGSPQVEMGSPQVEMGSPQALSKVAFEGLVQSSSGTSKSSSGTSKSFDSQSSGVITETVKSGKPSVITLELEALLRSSAEVLQTSRKLPASTVDTLLPLTSKVDELQGIFALYHDFPSHSVLG